MTADTLTQQQVIEACIDLTDEAGSGVESIDPILRVLGAYYAADRAHVFEINADYTLIDNTFEYCREGVSPEIGNLKNLPIESVTEWIAAFREKGVFFLSSLTQDTDPDSLTYKILAPQKIESLLAAPFYSDGEITGFVGVDNPRRCTEDLFSLRCAARFLSSRITSFRKKQAAEAALARKNDFISALTEAYEELILFDFKSNTEVIYRQSPYFVRPETELQRPDYQTRVDAFANSYVIPEDRLDYVSGMKESLIRQALAEAGRHAFRYRVSLNGTVQWYETRVINNDGQLKNDTLILGTRNVDAEIKKEEQRQSLLQTREMQSVIDLLANEYACVFYVDCSTGAETVYRWNENALGNIKKYPEIRDFSQRLSDMGASFVHAADRDGFLAATRKDYVLRQLEASGSYSHIFRISKKDGAVENWQIRFVYADEAKEKLVCGFRSVEHALRREVDRRREVEQQVRRSTADLKEKITALHRMSEGTVDLLGELVEQRDVESGEHIRRVKSYTFVLADTVRMALPEYGLTKEAVDRIVMASSLHDIGKIAIPDSILLKPGRLTDEEFKAMQAHSERGAEVIGTMKAFWDADFIETAYDICLCHHERWDGRGYPMGLSGDSIPIAAQIVAVADCYDALTSERVYKSAYAPEIAFDMILRGECGKLSDKMLSCLKLCRESFEKLARKGSGAVVLPAMQTEIYAGSGNASEKKDERVHTAEERRLAVIAGIARDYDFVCHINYLLDVVTPYHLSERFEKEYGALLHCPELPPENLDRFFHRFVLPEDMPSFRVPLERENAMAYLRQKHSLTHRFRGTVNGEVRYFDIRLILDEGESGHLILGLLDVNNTVQEKRRQLQDRNRIAKQKPDAEKEASLADLFLNSCFAAYYIDLADGSMRILRQDGKLTDRFGAQNDFSAFFTRIIDSYVHRDDRPMLSRAVSRDFMRNYLAAHPFYSTLFREISTGRARWMRLSVVRGYDAGHAAVSLADADDYMNRLRAFEDMEAMVQEDALTGVGNRIAYEKLSLDIDRVIRDGIVPNIAVIFCDLNNLKPVNDTYGHEAGDAYLKKCCRTILSICAHSKVFRIGGDEFVVLLEGEDFDNRERLLLKLSGCDSIASGMAVFDPAADRTLQDTLKRADEAMYAAKSVQKNG